MAITFTGRIEVFTIVVNRIAAEAGLSDKTAPAWRWRTRR
jgi:hypothetical protein